ncbi:AraC family transcriptional regulator [Rhodococcus sp. BUPNP1]|uniref:helix-turn-helix domain-containing protein n=1 Tax=Rhodococcus sp. BUPNP1 TaxID=1432786 RepID=UPI001557EB0E|nr:AraC family transcriptional regulator [Rhodococcus sp. BUPNP1]
MLWVWPGRAAYLGPSLELDPHSTSVYCVVVGVDAPFTLTAEDGTEISARSALVPPRLVHRVVSPPPNRILFCYADVNQAYLREHEVWRSDRCGPFRIGHREESVLIDLCKAPAPDGVAITATASGPPRRRLDPRIARTVERMRSDPSSERSAADLARAESLSTPYFLRLFGRETGTSFRRYRLWLRMLAVARTIAEGGDFTSAAMSAGFASPSHFSDTFLRMFGLTATALTASGVSIVVDERLDSLRQS